jgi:hypothetical protein
MTKTTVFIIIFVVCCLSLWLGFYFGKSSYVWIEDIQENQKADLFDRQNQCANMYSSVKQYLTDQYEFWNPEDWNNYSRIVSIDVWYSPKYDSCIAWLEYDRMIYKYTIKEHYYEPELNFKLINVTNWYSNIYTCIYRWDINNDCRDDYYLKKSEYHN